MKEFLTTGITVKHGYINQDRIGWSAECKWQGEDFMQPGYMEGIIQTRYLESTITEAIDYVLECIKQFGIKLCNEIEEMKEMGFALYRDEEEEQPEKVLQIIKIEAERRNWKCYVEI